MATALSRLLVAALAAALILPLLSFIPVYQVSEGREGVVVNTMLESRNFILPLRHAELIPSKPPLFHWVGAAVAAVMGEYKEFELRFPSALAAGLLVFSLFSLSARVVSPRAAFVAAGVLLSTYGFTRMAADGRVDMVFCLLMCLAIFRWMRALSLPTADGVSRANVLRRSVSEIAFYCGLAILTKGPLGMVLPVAVIVFITIICEGLLALRFLVTARWLWALVVSVPWYAFAYLLGGDDFLSRQLFFENVQRFSGGEGIPTKPPWFYLVEFWGHAAPWSVATVGLWWISWRASQVDSNLKTEAPAIASRRYFAKMCAVWIVVTILLISMSAGKRSAYLLPILPPFALLTGLMIDTHWARFQTWWLTLLERRSSAVSLVGNFFWLVVVSVALVFWSVGSFSQAENSVSPESAIPLFQHSARELLRDHQVPFVASMLVFSLASLYAWRRSCRTKSLGWLGVGVFSLFQLVLVICINVAYGIKGTTHTYRDFAKEISARVGAEPVSFVKRKWDESFDGFFFYFAKPVRLFDPGLPREFDRLKHSAELQVDRDTLQAGPPEAPGLYLMRRRWFAAVDDAWRNRVEEIFEGGRLIDKPEEKIVLFRLKNADSLTPEVPVAPARVGGNESDTGVSMDEPVIESAPSTEAPMDKIELGSETEVVPRESEIPPPRAEHSEDTSSR